MPNSIVIDGGSGGYEKAEYFIESIVPSLPLTPVSNEFDDVIEAAGIKAEYPLSFADCFAVATAKKKKLDYFDR